MATEAFSALPLALLWDLSRTGGQPVIRGSLVAPRCREDQHEVREVVLEGERELHRFAATVW